MAEVCEKAGELSMEDGERGGGKDVHEIHLLRLHIHATLVFHQTQCCICNR